VKAVVCWAGGPDGVGNVHIHSPGSERWEVCQCGMTAARWEEPQSGRLIVAAYDESKVRVLGLNNHLLLSTLMTRGRPAWETVRHWHDEATDAPGYVFDKSRAGCWAAVFEVGSTSDTRFAAAPELAAAFTEPGT
jgi:hypothetical protein